MSCQSRPDFWMTPNQIPVILGSRLAGHLKDAIRDADLADIVKQPSHLDDVQLRAGNSSSSAICWL